MSPFRKSRRARFTNTVREVRERANISIGELAEYCQVTPQTIEAIEESAYEPSIVLAEHIARKLDTPVEDLFHADDPIPPNNAGDEERIAAISNRRVARVLLFGVLIALIASVVLQLMPGYEQAARTMFVVWIVGAIAWFAAAGSVRGTASVNKLAASREPKPVAIRRLILNAAWFALLMSVFSYFDDRSRSLSRIALEWGIGGILYGVVTYLYKFGWRRKTG